MSKTRQKKKRAPRSAKEKVTIGVISKKETTVVKPDNVILIDDTNADQYLPVIVDKATFHEDKYRVILRRAAVIRLRASGLQYAEIVTRLKSDEMVAPFLPENYCELDAYKDVQIYLEYVRENLTEALPDIVAIENQRFDTALAAIWERVEVGEYRAIDMMLKISERRSKLLGLDQAIKIDWKIEILQLLQRGKLTIDDVKEELGEQLYLQLMNYADEQYDLKFGEQSKDVDTATVALWSVPPEYARTDQTEL